MAKLERDRRRLLHELWIPLVVRPLNGTTQALSWYLRTQKGGFTPKERAYLEKRNETLKEVSAELMKIYYRLKR